MKSKTISLELLKDKAMSSHINELESFAVVGYPSLHKLEISKGKVNVPKFYSFPQYSLVLVC